MTDLNLREIDLNLLTVFEAVYEEQSQSRAAERLGMTQPAISRALSRLCFLVGDRLFLGRAKGLNPTREAEALYPRIHQALDLVRGELASRRRFEPALSQRTFALAMGYGAGVILGPRLFRRLQTDAPRSRLVIRSIDPVDEIPSLLREHRLDLAHHHSRFDDPMLEQPVVTRNLLRLLMRRDHPRGAEPPTREALRAARYVTVHETSIRTEDRELARFLEDVTARSAMEVPNAVLLPVVLEATELWAVTTRQLAETLCQRHALHHYPLPFEHLPLHSYLIWHRAMNPDPAHAWLRERVLAELTAFNAMGES